MGTNAQNIPKQNHDIEESHKNEGVIDNKLCMFTRDICDFDIVHKNNVVVENLPKNNFDISSGNIRRASIHDLDDKMKCDHNDSKKKNLKRIQLDKKEREIASYIRYGGKEKFEI